MNAAEYETLAPTLQQLIKHIPLHWGKIQNNATDRQINLFAAQHIDDLEMMIATLTEADKNYFRRRWFLWQCARVDEYLFYRQQNIRKNPNPKDKQWDIEFHSDGRLRFDLKSTVVPRALLKHFHVKIERELIDFYYREQSKEVRFGLQNRLFIVHHSWYRQPRSMYLRCYWALKEQAYAYVNQVINNEQCLPFHVPGQSSARAKCLFVIEQADKTYRFHYNH